MATEILNNTRPTFTNEQKEAWNKAKLLLKTFAGNDTVRYRALHIAMSELRGRYRKHKGPIEAPSTNPNKLQQRQSCDKNAQLRERIDSWKVYFDNPGAKKLYIICDHTLTKSQKAVQSAHAAAQFLKEHPLAPWANGTLVLLQSCDKYQSTKYMCNTFEKFSDRYYTWRWLFKTEWREPDMDNALTAIAVLDDFNVIDNNEYTVKML